MQLSDFNPCVVELKSTEKSEALDELVAALLKHHNVPPERKEAILKKLNDREELGSTGIGAGVAVPHARSDVPEVPVSGLLVGVGVSASGVEFDSLDGKLVFVIVCLVMGQESDVAFMDLFAFINRIVGHEESLAKLKDLQPGAALPQFDPPPLKSDKPESEPNVPLWIAIVTAITLVVVLVKSRM